MSERERREADRMKHYVFCLDRVPTPVGDLLLLTDDELRLRAAEFWDCEARMRRLLRRHYGLDVTLRAGTAPATLRERLAAYFEGALDAIDPIETATGGTSFQRSVWAALREIPAGRTLTYRELANAVGRPRAVRAIGHANSINPVCIVVPCHRIVGADKNLAGYGGGLERKHWLLVHERALPADTPPPPRRSGVGGGPSTR